MLKSLKTKNKSNHKILHDFSVFNSNFKNNSIELSTNDIFIQTKNKLNKICEIPNKNTQQRIVTKKAINTFDFVLAILANENIINLTIAIYRIGKKTANELKELQKSGKIKNITILLNDGFPKLIPDCWNLLKSFESEKFKLKLENNHTKIILAETKENNYIIEGSGNLSINARIEQYTFDNNKQIYDFHKNWIDKI